MPDKPKPSDVLLPWRLVFIIFAAVCVVGGMAFAFLGPAYISGAISGLILGFFGTVFGDRVKTVAAIVAVTAVTTASFWSPNSVSYFVLVPLCAAMAGTELARVGTRVSVFAIMSWIILHGPAAAQTTPVTLLSVFAVSAMLGILLAVVLSAEGRIQPVALKKGYAATHAFALGAGLIAALLISTLFDNAQAHWIAMLFTARALDPPGSHVAQAAKRGFAMVAGAGLAGAAVALPATPDWFRLAGVALLLAGLRYLPSGRAMSSALISAGIVLATSPTAQTALFRAEAAVVASCLVLAVFFLVSAFQQVMSRK